ncbi:MAG TPA: formate dehydrogenase accessory protein FdhE [Roseiarcus sp.]|nr:formate dehydrogenase accessory protein FdhE [Roseiarcus sp.]
MPRKLPIAADPTAIGAVAAPPFVRLPDPHSLFALRARRFRTLAPSSGVRPYLELLSDLADAQAEVAHALPPPPAPEEAALARARDHGMPPLDRAAISADGLMAETLDRLFAAAAARDGPAAARAALGRAAAARGEERDRRIDNVLFQAIPADDMAEHAYVAASLQIHLARLAAVLAAERLQPIADGVCPACGGPPVASLIVGWQSAHGARFAACSLCGVLWHVVRIKCLRCGSTEGIRYQEIDGGPGLIKAETCEACQSYVKIFHQHKDPDLDPVADDVGSLALDLLMHDGPYRRAGFNPFLLGY